MDWYIISILLAIASMVRCSSVSTMNLESNSITLCSRYVD